MDVNVVRAAKVCDDNDRDDDDNKVKRAWRDEVLPPYHLKIVDADPDGTYHQKIALRLAGCIFCTKEGMG